MAGFSSGRILRIREIKCLGNSLDGQSVRTWGRVHCHNIADQVVEIKDSGQELIICSNLIEPVALQIGHLYQFIGEMTDTGRESLVLRARVAICIDGLDLNLFQQALDIRRNYLGEESIPSYTT